MLADGPMSRSLGVHPAWIRGVGHSQDAYSLGSRELHKAVSAKLAARRAYEMASITDPHSELDVIEVSEFYAYQELMLYEALDLCAEGDGALLFDAGVTALDGQTPVNPSGGALCANPLVATGLVRLAESAAQVSNRGGNVQIDGARTALAHSGGGFAMQSAACVILER